MEPTESAAPDSRLRLRRMTGAWMAGLRTGRTEERAGQRDSGPLMAPAAPGVGPLDAGRGDGLPGREPSENQQ